MSFCKQRKKTSDEFKAEEHVKQSVMNRIFNQRITVLLAMDAVSYTFKSMCTSKQVVLECLAHDEQGKGGGLFSYGGQAKPLGRSATGVESKVRRSRQPHKDLGKSTRDGRNSVWECPGRAASFEKQVKASVGEKGVLQEVKPKRKWGPGPGVPRRSQGGGRIAVRLKAEASGWILDGVAYLISTLCGLYSP